MSTPVDLYYYCLSAPSCTARVFLEVTGIPHTLTSISVPAGETRSESYLKVNPVGTVPFIKEGDFGLGDAGAIMMYLADSRPEVADHWYPKDLKARSAVNAVMLWHGSTLRTASVGLLSCRVLGPLLGGAPVLTETIDNVMLPKTKAALRARRRGEHIENLSFLWCSPFISTFLITSITLHMQDINDAFLADQDFVAGPEISIADLLLACEVKELRLQDATGSGFGYKSLLSEYPKIEPWLARVAEHCAPYFTNTQKSVNLATTEILKKVDDASYKPDLGVVEAAAAP